MPDNSSESHTPSPQLDQNSARKPLLERPVEAIGSVATKTAIDLKLFLQKEVKLPTAEQLIGTQIKRPLISTPRAIAEIKRIVQRSREVLISATTVFPPTLFQNSIIVDRTKITIVKRSFIWSSDVISIRIEDVLNVSTSVGPIFGSISIASRVMNSTDHFEIGSFWRGTAMDIKHIIQGYMIARNNNIDTDHLSVQELVNTLSELGHDSGP